MAPEDRCVPVPIPHGPGQTQPLPPDPRASATEPGSGGSSHKEIENAPTGGNRWGRRHKRESYVNHSLYRRGDLVTAVLILAAISLAGCVGLWRCAPRPAAQEAWATVVLAPVFLLLMFAALTVAMGGAR